MSSSNAEHYPQHDRTSCSDENPCNAEAGGSNGCARCTALAMDGAGALPLMRQAFVTAVSDGQDGLYELRFKFRTLAELHAAHREWLGVK